MEEPETKPQTLREAVLSRSPARRYRRRSWRPNRIVNVDAPLAFADALADDWEVVEGAHEIDSRVDPEDVLQVLEGLLKHLAWHPINGGQVLTGAIREAGLKAHFWRTQLGNLDQ